MTHFNYPMLTYIQETSILELEGGSTIQQVYFLYTYAFKVMKQGEYLVTSPASLVSV